MKQDNVILIVWWLVVVSFVIAFALVCSGCATEKRWEKFNKLHPEKLSEKCGENFRVDTITTVHDSLHIDTAIIDNPVTVFDTIYVENRPVVISKKCPPSQVITQTKIQTVERTVENTARVKYLEGSLQIRNEMIAVLEAKNKELAASRAKFRLWFWIAVGAVAAAIGFKVFRFIHTLRP